ncbi:YhdP family protein [uncultured Paraglaciecola sp.]|uniref:YhdP family protein n=1 Tax=uncultured Paraglaciecola sp. TaxID=1765024 RepID=UPI00261A7329|nr:YhdP family protein [uncultured Paraglaciecola sp.]
MNTKTKSASYYVAYLIKKLWALVALSLVVVAVTLSVVRYSLPYLNDQKSYLEQWLSGQVGAQIEIGEISAKWQGIGPAIVLRDIQLIQNAQSPISLNIAETAIEVNFWESVRARQIQANKFDLRQMEVSIDIASLEQENNQYPIVDALETLFLQQLQLFSISQSKIIINTRNKHRQVVLIDQVSWVNKGDHHQGVGQLQVEEIARNSASFVLDLYGNQENLYGTFFAKGEEVDLSPWIKQLLPSDKQLVESRGSFVMWAAIKENSLQSLQLDLSNSHFNWQSLDNATPENNLNAVILGGQVNAIPVNNEWMFNLHNLTMQINDNVLVSNWVGKIDPKGAMTLQHKQPLKLAPVLPMLNLALAPSQVSVFESLHPQATLRSIDIFRSLSGEVAVNASLSDIQWQQTEFMPGMAGLATELNWYNGNGRLNLKAKSGRLLIDKLLENDIDYQRFYADLYIHTASENFSILAEDILFKSDVVSLRPHFFYRSLDKFLAFATTVDRIDVATLPQLYPSQLMGVKTKKYLVDSLLQGQVINGQLIWHGSLDSFPFDQNQGVFQAQLQVVEAELKFDKQWPTLSNLDVNLLFENADLTMTSQKGRLLDVELVKLSASITELTNNALLSIDINAQANGQQVTDLMLQSSLADTLGKTLQQVQVSGSLATKLNLHIPLYDQPIVATGSVQLSDNIVALPSLDILLQQTNGTVSFVNSEVTANDLKGQLLRQPIRVSLTGEQQDIGYQTDINVKGQWQVDPLLETFAGGLKTYLSGSSNWNANIALTLPTQGGYQYFAEVSSDLLHLGSKLPKPFAKTADQSLPLLVTSQGNQQASLIKITLGKDIEFNGNLPHQDMQFSRAHLAIGQADLMGMGLGFSISATLPELNVSPWYTFINTLVDDLPDNSEKSLISAPKRIFVNADSAVIAAQRLTGLEMVVKNTSDSWLFDINATEARVNLALSKDWLSKGVNIDASFIDLASWQDIPTGIDGQVSDANHFVADIDNLPPINFSCARCRFLDNDLGKVDFKLSRAASGMKIEQLRFNNAHGVFYGSGDWFLDKNQSSTHLTGEFNSSDFGAFLKDYKLDSGIKDSKASAQFDLSWDQAPYEFNFETLKGHIDWGLSDGYLTEVSDQGSRIFTLLSLDSLVRKLKLDFRDIFAKGFFYDKIDGSFQVENGVVHTKDTVVDGGAGELTMQGYTDLNAQQLNYQIEFSPNVTSSLPVIVAWMVNPATALAALALDQMLTSAKVISNIKFSLTGSLDDPQLKELGRNSKEVSLPASVKPEVEQPSQPIDQQLDTPIDIQAPDEIPLSG